MPAHRTQNSRHLRVEPAPVGAPPINIISPTPQTFFFDSGAINAQASEASSYPFASQASRSLPNLFTFHASPTGEYPNYSDSQSPSGSQRSSLYTSYGESPTSTSSFFASPAHSLKGSSFASSPPDSTDTPSLSPSPPPYPYPPQMDGDRPVKSRSRSSSSPAPYPHPLPPHSNGQVRTQPPRPPNPWICFRNVRSAQYKELNYPEIPKSKEGHSAPGSPATGTLGLDGESVRRPRQADLSKHISLEWKSLTDEEKAPYIRMSEEAKLVHARVYPGYKYQPKRKADGGSPTKKGSLRVDASKKNAKTKKSGKSSKVVKKDESRETEIPADMLLEEVSGEMSQTTVKPIAEIEFSNLGFQIGNDESEDSPGAGDPSKEWTWLPEQTLLPITWEQDQEFGYESALDNVMHPLDANIEDGNEDENEFGKPLYLSFPPSEHQTEDQTSGAPWYPTAPSDTTIFPNFNFSSSTIGLQDDHLDAFPDVSQHPEHAVDGITADFGPRRDSLSTTASDYELPDCSNAYFPFSYESISESLGFTSQELEASYAEDPSLPSNSYMSPVRPSSPVSLTYPVEVPPVTPPRRASFAQSSITSPDGHLCPPVVSPVRPHGRPRSKTTPTPRPSSLDVPSGYNDMRTIPTTVFGVNSGVMTSVLIPMTTQRCDQDLERDLEEYTRGLESVASASDGTCGGDGGSGSGLFSSFQLGQPPSLAGEKSKAAKRGGGSLRGQSLDGEDKGLDVTDPEFDFEAEFGDIIDIHSLRSRSGAQAA